MIPGIELPDRAEPGPAFVSVSGFEMRMWNVEQPRPAYPENQRAQGRTDSVRLIVVIGPDGSVTDMDATSGGEDFVRAAAAAVSRWKYRPFVHRGRAHNVLTALDVNFRLR